MDNDTFLAVLRFLPWISAAAVLLGAVLLAVSIRQRARFRRWVTVARIATSTLIVLLGLALVGISVITTPIRTSAGAVGESASALAYVDADGDTGDVGDFRGRVVVLNAWATWCGPCVAEMPELDRLQAAYPDDVAVVALSDEDQPTLERYVRANDFGFTLGRAAAPDRLAGPYAGFFGVRPTTLVIDRDGVIRATLIGEQTLASLEAQVTPLL